MNSGKRPLVAVPWINYADLLSYKGHGFAMWDPNPRKLSQDPEAYEMQIGDVGFFELGGFKRLFNCVKPADDPVNSGGVPEDFEVLRIPNKLRSEVLNYLDPGLLISQSTHDHEVSTGAGGGR